MSAKARVKYDLLESGWRAGIKTPEELALDYQKATGDKVSRVAIIKHFEKKGIPRDLQKKIRAKADALVRQASFNPNTPEAKLTETVAIESEAQRQTFIRLEHRENITRMRALVLRLLSECEATSEDPEVFYQLGELMRNPSARGQDKLNEAYQRAVSLPQRIKGVKELAETLRVLIALEREAYGIDGKPAGDSAFERLLQEVHEAADA